MYAENLSLFFSFLSLRLCLCLRHPGLQVRRNDISTSTRERFFSFLSLRLCLCLRHPGLQVRRNDTSTSTNARERKSFHSLVLVLASLCHTCKPERRKHKHKRKHKALVLESHRFTRRFLVLMLVFCIMLAS